MHRSEFVDGVLTVDGGAGGCNGVGVGIRQMYGLDQPCTSSVVRVMCSKVTTRAWFWAAADSA